MRPDRSVVICVYNRADTLAGSLRAVTAQSFPRQQYEVVVIDDGSTDESARGAARRILRDVLQPARAATMVTPSTAQRWKPRRLWRRVREVYRGPQDVRFSLQLAYFIWRLPNWLDRQPLPSLLDQLRAAPRPTAADLRSSVERIDRLSRPWFATFFRGRNTCYVRSFMFCRFVDAGGDALRMHLLIEPRRTPEDRLRGHAWVSAGAEFCEAPQPELLGRTKRFYIYPADDDA